MAARAEEVLASACELRSLLLGIKYPSYNLNQPKRTQLIQFTGQAHRDTLYAKVLIFSKKKNSVENVLRYGVDNVLGAAVRIVAAAEEERGSFARAARGPSRGNRTLRR